MYQIFIVLFSDSEVPILIRLTKLKSRLAIYPGSVGLAKEQIFKREHCTCTVKPYRRHNIRDTVSRS